MRSARDFANTKNHMRTTQHKNPDVFYFLLTYEIAIYLFRCFLTGLTAAGPRIQPFDPQYAITVWFLGTALLPLFMGPIAARYGDRRVLLLGAVVYLLSNVVCATTHSAGLFLFARVTQGACVAAMNTPGYAILHRTLDQKKAIKTLAWMSSITVLAPTAGPLLGALMLTLTSWHGIFVLLAGGTAIAIVGLFVFTPHRASIEPDATTTDGLWQNYRAVLSAPHYLRFKLTQCSLFAAISITASPMLLMTYHHYTSTQFALAQCAVFSSFIVGPPRGWLLRHTNPARFLRISTLCAATTGVLA